MSFLRSHFKVKFTSLVRFLWSMIQQMSNYKLVLTSLIFFIFRPNHGWLLWRGSRMRQLWCHFNTTLEKGWDWSLPLQCMRTLSQAQWGKQTPGKHITFFGRIIVTSRNKFATYLLASLPGDNWFSFFSFANLTLN
jgi:hypothetical protein